jgi:hypothetical protein
MSKGFVDRRLELGWDPQLEGGLPDCRPRARRDKHRVHRRDGVFDKVYCANCGKFDGLVSSDWTPHVYALCNECARRFRAPAGAIQLTPEQEATARGQKPTCRF